MRFEYPIRVKHAALFVFQARFAWALVIPPRPTKQRMRMPRSRAYETPAMKRVSESLDAIANQVVSGAVTLISVAKHNRVFLYRVLYRRDTNKLTILNNVVAMFSSVDFSDLMAASRSETARLVADAANALSDYEFRASKYLIRK
jgi:hypothetical protein